MYLKEIKCAGFKSFADKVTIDLTGGISGIVGPNGSGKSNVVDAVRWVLGEQSVKSLRGEGAMSDVIFSGSKSRKAASSASVTLVFNNEDKYLPIDYTEVSVKRSIYRTGENEYYINNEKCRLKDIQDLFMDTGVSKESFNIISQGDIGVILSNKPEDRRLIFEAASGTLKYKKRKEEALRKLDRTHDNLNRVNDIISELESSVEPLKEQREKAQKYLEDKKKLDEIEVSLIVSEVDEINTDYQSNKKAVEAITEEISQIESQNSKDMTKQEELKLKEAKMTDELYALQQNYVSLTTAVEALDGKKNLIIERQKYDSGDVKLHDNIVNLKERILRKENEIFGSNNGLDIANKKLLDANAKLSDVDTKFQSLKQRHDVSLKELSQKSKEENELRYKADMLKESIESNSLLPYAVKCVLDNPKLTGIRGTIGSVIDTDEKYAMAISTALGFATSYVITDDELAAKDAINFLKINKYGRATFFPLNVIKGKEIDNHTYQILEGDTSFVGTASSLVKYESTYDQIIQNQLGNTIVVTDIDALNGIARKTNYKYRIVSLDGEILHVGGSLTGGTVKNNSNIITQKRDLEETLRNLSILEKQISEFEMSINVLDDEYKNVSLKRDDVLKSVTETTSMLKYEEERKKTLEKELLSLKEEVSNLSSLKNNTLSKEENEIVEAYYEKLREKNELELKLNALRDDLESLKEDIRGMEKDERENNSSYYQKQNILKELEIKVNRQDVKLDTLLNTLTEDYSLTFERAKSNYFLEIDKDEARKIVDKCKLEIKRLGDVNTGAIEEYERVSKRYEFLTNQRNDLLNAEKTILEIIDELDDIMKDKFLKTFDEIKDNFKAVFKDLFGGGKAELSLSSPSDVLTTGIEIKALPPGKTLQHISLLSGGEKTLTAIALLFAILKTRPVPFCILDEVEAALDEVNVDTFGKFLKAFKGATQFIVITHKKKTMEYADVLYGMTMQESGVSKLVSVKLEDIKK